MFKVLSDLARLKLIVILTVSGETCVCHLTEALGVSESTVSRHLGVLRTNGLVKARRKGTPMAERRMSSPFEKHLTVWVTLCIFAEILLGKAAPDPAGTLDDMSIPVGGASAVSIPIAVCLFMMMYLIIAKINLGSVVRAGKSQARSSHSFHQLVREAVHLYGIALLQLVCCSGGL